MIDFITAIASVFIIILCALFGRSLDKEYSGSREYFGDDGVIGGIDSKLQKQIATKYKGLKRTKKIPFKDYCFPKTYTLQQQQLFVQGYMKDHDELLIFHKPGAGKTCAAIRAGSNVSNAIVVMPASLIPGFESEVAGQCGKNVKTKFHPVSYNKFATDGESMKAEMLIVDEVQNVLNASGSFCSAIVKWIQKHPKSKVIIMSGTPVFDNYANLATIAKMLRIKSDEEITPEFIRKNFAGKVSYYPGAPSYTFPEVTIKLLKCEMSDFQSKWYKSEIEAEKTNSGKIKTHEIPNNFYIKSRQRSNIVYPKGLTGASGLAELTPSLIKSSLATYSVKFDILMYKLNKAKRHSVVYIEFTGPGGIESLEKCLQVYGWKNYAKDGPGKRRYAVWSGDQNLKDKAKLRDLYNSSANDDCSKIELVIGSSAMKEGVTLLRTKRMYVMGTYWNEDRLEQIYARVNRYCSHKTLPVDERIVKIYVFAAYIAGGIAKWKKEKKSDSAADISIDQYMLDIAKAKEKENEPYIKALVDVAVDKLVY
jgi:hypothetical protein